MPKARFWPSRVIEMICTSFLSETKEGYPFPYFASFSGIILSS
jgi:hypothetical protein